MSRNKTPSKNGNETVRCAIYTRKSTEEGLEQQFNSLDAQRESAEAYIASQTHENWSAIPVRYDDGGFTGGNMERPALARLLADIESGKIDCVVVYKVDRLSRSLLDFARLIEIFDKHKVAFVSVTQQFNTSNSMGRLVLNVLLSFAQFEREIIGERIRDKIAATKKKGKWAGGVPILGFDLDRNGQRSRLVTNAKEAALVREIFQLYVSLGSLLPVVDELAKRGWLNKAWKTTKGDILGGKPFNKASLHKLLTNPLYIGKIRHKSNLYQGEHEAILEYHLFQKVQDMLRRNWHAGGPLIRNRHGALLRGLLYCKHCGYAMTHTFSSKGTKRYRYYTCVAVIKSGRKACSSPSLPASEVEKVVIEQISAIANDSDLRAEVLRQVNEQLEQELSDARREHENLKRELTRHHNELRKLLRDGKELASIADLHVRTTQAETRLTEVAKLLEDRSKEQLSKSDIDTAFAEFDKVWTYLSPRDQIKLMSLLVSRVEFDSQASTIAVSFHPTGIKTLIHNPLGVTA